VPATPEQNQQEEEGAAPADQPALPAESASPVPPVPPSPPPTGDSAVPDTGGAAGDTAPGSDADATLERSAEGASAEEMEKLATEGEIVGTEVIEVTGSLIRRDNLTGHGPVTVVKAEDLNTRSATTVNEVLEQMPSVSLQGTNKNQNNGGNGVALIDLRNLGSGRTLILVNGRRAVSDDLNTIPAALLDRVEVLLDGASAAYGSDAIGGVVNFILKSDFQGARFDAHTGISQRGDGESTTISGTVGQNFGRGNVTLHLGFTRNGEIKQKDRDWSRNDVISEGYTEDGRVLRVGSSATGHATVFANDSLLRVNGTELTEFNGDDPSQYFNIGDHQWLNGSLQRFSSALLGRYQLSDKVNFYTEAMFTNRHSETNLAPQPLSPNGTVTFPNGFQVSLDLPTVPANLRDMVRGVAPETASVGVLRRIMEAGDRHSEIDVNTFQAVSGLRGHFGGEKRYDWDTYIGWGVSQSTVVMRNAINMARALESANDKVCEANAARGCVVGDYLTPGGLEQGVIDYIRYDDTEVGGGEQFLTAATLTGPLMQLGPNDIKFAVGNSFRHISAFNRPDAVTVAGDSAGNAQQPVEGTTYAYDAFGELSIPLAAKLPGLHQLTADLSGRWSWFDTFGDATTFRTGLTYSPVAELRLRGSYATAFRAPSIGDLYSGSTDSYLQLKDPCSKWTGTSGNIYDNCRNGGAGISPVPENYDQAATSGSQIRTDIGGNPELEAETAKVFNVGMVYWPGGVLEGLSVTTDYYRVTVDNAITTPDVQSILDDCYGSTGLSHPKCQFIGRDPMTGAVNSLNARVQNVGQLKTSGVDVALGYGFAAGRGGRINLGWQGNYLLGFEEDLEGEKTEFAGKIARNAGTYARVRWIAQGGYARGPWSLNNAVRFIGGADRIDAEKGRDPTLSVPAIAYWDLSAHYQANRLGVIIGVDNVLDQDPPFIPGSDANSNANTYDYVGRFAFTRLSYQF
jgi:iron complex outermembrane receptor protein